MQISVKAFRNEFSEHILNFVWHQWCRIGVAGSAPRNSRWIIDPEPLLAFTTEVGRLDARMFDEVLEWLVTNGRWINTQRLATIAGQDMVGDNKVIGAIASWMSQQDKSLKWRGLARRMIPAKTNRAEALFIAQTEIPAGVANDFEEHFGNYGLLRGPIRTRGMTKAVNMKDPSNIMFKCRAAFGIGIRADVMACLVATDGGHARGIAKILGYNHMRVSEVLAGMAEAGMVTVYSIGRTKQYRADRQKWQSVIMPDMPAVLRWLNWRPLTRALTTLWREVRALDDTRADAYVFSSKMRKAMLTAIEDLQKSDLDFVIEDDKDYPAEDYLPVFVMNVKGILSCLEGRQRCAKTQF